MDFGADRRALSVPIIERDKGVGGEINCYRNGVVVVAKVREAVGGRTEHLSGLGGLKILSLVRMRWRRHRTGHVRISGPIGADWCALSESDPLISPIPSQYRLVNTVAPARLARSNSVNEPTNLSNWPHWVEP